MRSSALRMVLLLIDFLALRSPGKSHSLWPVSVRRVASTADFGRCTKSLGSRRDPPRRPPELRKGDQLQDPCFGRGSLCLGNRGETRLPHLQVESLSELWTSSHPTVATGAMGRSPRHPVFRHRAYDA